MKMSFDCWIALVDRYTVSMYGLSIHDLPDCCFRDWYDDGVSYQTAAKRAIRMANE